MSLRASCREIFERVVDLPPKLRGAVVRDACTGDIALQGHIERLLAAHDGISDFLEVPPLLSAGPREQHRVGRYEIVRKLGEGGMGSVFLAEPGPVAVKLIRRDLDPSVLIRRFQREQDMLSRLDHPNIARLIEGGATEDGTPYLVLTYVDGVPLDQFCNGQRLSLLDRLHLFRTICRAVSFAHGRLVIHRDLKPANVLVTHDGVPIVLDFGLAKLARTSLEASLDSTATGHRLLTPEYASPEQVQGLRVTPAVDVYALGLILYELLVGVRPQRFHTWSIAEIVDVVCNAEVVPPSLGTSADTSWPIASDNLRGTLDFIVMKAIAKAPEKRYSHLAQLDDDLLRYLEGRPIPGNELEPYQA